MSTSKVAKQLVLFIALLLIGARCKGSRSGSTIPSPQVAEQRKSQTNTATTFEVQGFNIEVTLSEKAKKELTGRKETIAVFGFLTGNPKPGALKKYFSHPGPIGLGEFDAEGPLGKVIKVGKIKVRQDAFEQTDKQDPKLLINVVSGRKSSEDNLLECDDYEGPLKAIQGSTVPIACKLIRGEK